MIVMVSYILRGKELFVFVIIVVYDFLMVKICNLVFVIVFYMKKEILSIF